jgi:heterodisulfide reductase subunit A-like polyferredoxin
MKQQYHCIHCMACEEQDTVTHPIYKCKFDGDNKELKFNVGTKIPCTRFIPADYIAALNYDTR